MFQRNLVISICVLLFIGLSINQVNGETVNKRHSIDLKAAYWDNAVRGFCSVQWIYGGG